MCPNNFNTLLLMVDIIGARWVVFSRSSILIWLISLGLAYSKSHDVILESFHHLLELLSPNNTFHSIKNYWKNICFENFCFYMVQYSTYTIIPGESIKTPGV